ncbi:Peptide chain release factor eRF1/aRF1 like protein [Aduncisulcus paluster]|uniref:Peptide chain release factor eRF1/aRF1 like protein n=1 Tax=Aduncisulcus paluster TaxID=2918883 RepID=A0ABQ5KJ35_9EUKA|nr:Peptide chain release factor eRF1/aRF1 like protein [Aduncisulcus paluster]
MSGSANFKSVLSKSDLFDGRLADKAIQLSEDVLKDVKFMQEKKLIVSFFEEITTDSGKYCFGVDDMMCHLDLSCVEKLIVFEDHPWIRYELRDEDGGLKSSSS